MHSPHLYEFTYGVSEQDNRKTLQDDVDDELYLVVYY